MDRMWKRTGAVPRRTGTLVQIAEPHERTQRDFELANTMDEQGRKVGELHGGVDAIESLTSRLASFAASSHEDREEEGVHGRTNRTSGHEL